MISPPDSCVEVSACTQPFCSPHYLQQQLTLSLKLQASLSDILKEGNAMEAKQMGLSRKLKAQNMWVGLTHEKAQSPVNNHRYE